MKDDRNIIQSSVLDATQWFSGVIDTIKEAVGAKPKEKPETEAKATEKPEKKKPVFLKNISADDIGSMVAFSYHAKHDKTLKYWDAYPLIFPIDMRPGGFIGINLHYLPYQARAKLLNALRSLEVEVDKKRTLIITYDILKAVSRFKYFRPCLKEYLYNQVRSKFLYIEPEEWNNAIMIPNEMFKKVSAEQVWKESMQSIKPIKGFK